MISAARDNEPPHPAGDAICFWISVVLGIVIAAAFFGIVVLWPEGGLKAVPVGGFLGALIGFFVSIPVVLTCCMICWPIWHTRYRDFAAVIAGAATGLLSTTGPIAFPATYSTASSIIGAIGALCAARYFVTRTQSGVRFARRTGGGFRNFKLRELFAYFTGIAIVLSIWISVYRVFSQ